MYVMRLLMDLYGLTVIHDMTLIHTDLKPENVLLVSSDYVVEHISEDEVYMLALKGPTFVIATKYSS